MAKVRYVLTVNHRIWSSQMTLMVKNVLILVGGHQVVGSGRNCVVPLGHLFSHVLVHYEGLARAIYNRCKPEQR